MYRLLLENLAQSIESRLLKIDAVYNFDNGEEFEIALCEILEAILPNKYGVCRGFIVDREEEILGDDIIIYDRLRFPTIRMIGEKKYAQKEKIPFEAVYCYIEAKHNLELGDENSSLSKALEQIQKIKFLKRAVRPHSQITDTFALGSASSLNLSIGFASIANPLYTCIISRRTSLGKLSPVKSLDAQSTYDALVQSRLLAQSNMLPDLIIAGEGVLAIPYLERGENKHIVPFLASESIKGMSVFKTKYNALAVGIVHMLWALSRIQHSEMPWEEIIIKALY